MSELLDLQRLVHAMPGLCMLLRPDAGFTIVAASAEYLNATHTDASILGRPLFEVFPDNPEAEGVSGAQALRASLERVVADRQPHQMAVTRYDVERSAAQGGGFEERYWLPANVPVLGDDGRVDYIVHRAEEAATRGSREAVKILESITEGFFTLDRRWRFDYVNAEAHQILGMAPGTLAGRVLWEVYPGLEETPFWGHYHQAMVERVKSSFVAEYPNQARWYDVTVFPAPEGISVYFRDVTKHRLLEVRRDALADLSERLGNASDTDQVAFEGATVIARTLGVARAGYGSVDHDTGALFVDRDWTRPGVDSLAGVTPLTDYGTLIDSLREGQFMAIRDVRTDPRTASAVAALEAKHARAFVNVPVMERGRLVAVVFVNDDAVRDWTPEELGFVREAAARIRTAVERATAERDLRASEETYRHLSAELADAGRKKDEFLATLAHELRNPLAPIRNALVIQSRTEDPAVVAQARQLMERQVDHMVRLIDDLLDVSRLSRGVIHLQREHVSIASAVALAVEASRPVVERAGNALSLALPDEDLVVFADPVRVTQVVTNLLDNAAKFTPAGGRVGVALERAAGEAVLTVSDTGMGMAAEVLERIFGMFEQVDQSHAESAGGLGIGLTLVRRLVEAHGGSVHAASAGLGAGSTFHVRLPLAVQPASTPGRSSGAGDAPSPRVGLRVVVADDNQDAADTLAMFLEMSGHDTRVATDGAQAVALCEAFRPDAAVLDIAMPVQNGLDAARAIRAAPRGEDVLLLALSGFGQASDKQRSADAGFDLHLVKPFDLVTLEGILLAGRPPRPGGGGGLPARRCQPSCSRRMSALSSPVPWARRWRSACLPNCVSRAACSLSAAPSMAR